MYISHLVTLTLDSSKCVGCGLCKIVCPHRIFEIENRKAKIIKKESCIECGACMSNCPTGAIDVKAGVGCAQAIFNGGKCNC